MRCFAFFIFLVKHVYNQDVLVEHSLALARCRIIDWPEAEFSHPWCHGCAVYQWSTQLLHLPDISGYIQMKRIPYMQSISVFWKPQPCSWGLWTEKHLEGHVHSKHGVWFDNADSFQLNVCASRVLQEACPAPGFQQRYHFHTFSKQLTEVFLQMQHSWCRNVFCGWVAALWARTSWEENNTMKKKFWFSLCCDIFVCFFCWLFFVF